MDFGNTRTYELELWSSNGYRTADISSLAKGRQFSIERNESEELSFSLDLYEIEEFASHMGTTAAQLLMPYQMDVKVKRDGQYLFGTQIVSAPLQIGSDYTMSVGGGGGGAGSFNPTITVNCKGYLDLFQKRYHTETFTNTERTTVAGDMLMNAQSETNGDVGVTLASGQYETGTTDPVRALNRVKIKRYLQELTQLPDGRFDFKFTHDKEFQTYATLGSVRTDLQFNFGGTNSNIIDLYLERSAASLYNQIIGLGSGNGQETYTSTQDDTVSQLNNLLRQDVRQYNDIANQDILEKRVAADLALSKDLLQIPQITISGAELRNKNFLEIGDRIPLKFVGHNFFHNVDGLYRIEKMVVSLDDNDFEKTIELYFDNYALEES
jgi:hypothetical protein